MQVAQERAHRQQGLGLLSPNLQVCLYEVLSALLVPVGLLPLLWSNFID